MTLALLRVVLSREKCSRVFTLVVIAGEGWVKGVLVG